MTEARQANSLDKHLRAVWRRDRTRHIGSGALAFLRWAVALFLVGMLFDWLLDLPTAGRLIVLLGILAVGLWKAWLAGWRHLRRYDATRVALQVEKEHGGMDSLLVTAVDFAKADEPASGSGALREHTRQLAEQASEPLEPRQTISFRGLRRLALLALVPLLVLLGFAIYNGPFVLAGLGRIFAPWMSLEYPTRTQIAVVDGDHIVKEGEGVLLAANLGGEVPDSAAIVLRTGEGKPRERRLAVHDSRCSYPVETAFRSFDYRIEAGDAESEWHRVEVVSAPRIERAEVTLEYPEYTRRPTETVEALTMTVPEGTTIHWKLTLDRALAQAEFRPAEGEPRSLDLGDGGRSVRFEASAGESRAYSFGWVDRDHGFAFASPRHYLQVAPDQMPGVDLTSPSANLYATLGRKLDFAYRGRDDHGIGEAAMVYRIGKTAETRVELPTPEHNDGAEQRVDWDYQRALPDLAVGDTVSFVVELADRYPGADGPHRVRSEARRVQFLSRQDYLAQIEKQKRRLLGQVRTVYREERAVHDLVRTLDPSTDVFVQTCQLEAVRQDLIRERLGSIRVRIDELVADLAANEVSEEAQSTAMVELGANLERIENEEVSEAAVLLRQLASVDDRAGQGRSPAAAIERVDGAARELGLVVLQLGFAEASDVMARELHATAQTQAALRLATLISASEDETRRKQLAEAQQRLAQATARLLASIPRNRESTSRDALVAFNLSRLVNGLVRSGTESKMKQAASLIPDAATRSQETALLQAEIVSSLLRAEFRLRIGSEYAALAVARDFFDAQAAGQNSLRVKGEAVSGADFDGAGADLGRSQQLLQRQLQLLLMPEVPGGIPQLFDTSMPAAPPVDDLLARAELAMAAALAGIEAGDREATIAEQSKASAAFTDLAAIARVRMNQLTRQKRMQGAVTGFAKQAAQLLMLEERLLVLLEQTEDAIDDEKSIAPLAALNHSLAEDAAGFRRTMALWKENEGGDLPLLHSLDRVASALKDATPQVRENKPDEAIELQEQALDAIEEADAMIEELRRIEAAFAGVLATTGDALAASPLLTEIEAEQIDLTTISEKARPEDYPGLVVPQKNLIHAVDAVLTSLDPLAHKIETGTTMLFAKEDMDAAAVGLETEDIEETLDAQAFVVESLQELRGKIDAVTPEYRYVREVTGFLYDVAPRGTSLRTGLRQLADEAEGAPDPDDLKRTARQFAVDLHRLTGMDRFAETGRHLESAIDSPQSEDEVDDAFDALADDGEDLQLLMENFAFLIAPVTLTTGPVEEPTAEMKLIGKVLPVAAHHHELTRATHVAQAGGVDAPALAKLQRRIEADLLAMDPTIHPQLGAAHRQLMAAAASLESGNRKAAIEAQTLADDALRFFLVEYVLEFVDVPPPAPPEPPAPSADAIPEDGELQLFLPGALTGERPKGGRQEWNVLGTRDRAALNENFARELPLEYRAILKDYYERLTE